MRTGGRLPIVAPRRDAGRVNALETPTSPCRNPGKTTTDQRCWPNAGSKVAFEPDCRKWRGIIHAYGFECTYGARCEWMVVEADESDGTFNRLPGTIAIRDQHRTRTYGALGATLIPLRKGFWTFVSNIPFYGWLSAAWTTPKCKRMVGQDHDRPKFDGPMGFNTNKRCARRSNLPLQRRRGAFRYRVFKGRRDHNQGM